MVPSVIVSQHPDLLNWSNPWYLPPKFRETTPGNTCTVSWQQLRGEDEVGGAEPLIATQCHHRDRDRAPHNIPHHEDHTAGPPVCQDSHWSSNYEAKYFSMKNCYLTLSPTEMMIKIRIIIVTFIRFLTPHHSLWAPFLQISAKAPARLGWVILNLAKPTNTPPTPLAW